MITFVLRNARTLTSEIAKRSAFVSSILEYSLIIWAPSEQNRVLEIEIVQRRSVRYLYIHYTIYSTRVLCHLNLSYHIVIDIFSEIMSQSNWLPSTKMWYFSREGATAEPAPIARSWNVHGTSPPLCTNSRLLVMRLYCDVPGEIR